MSWFIYNFLSLINKLFHNMRYTFLFSQLESCNQIVVLIKGTAHRVFDNVNLENLSYNWQIGNVFGDILYTSYVIIKLTLPFVFILFMSSYLSCSIGDSLHSFRKVTSPYIIIIICIKTYMKCEFSSFSLLLFLQKAFQSPLERHNSNETQQSF